MPLGYLALGFVFVLLAASLAAAVTFAYVTHQTSRQPATEELRAEFAKAAAQLAEERAAMRVEFARGLEEASGLGEVVERNRARIEQAEARKRKREGGGGDEPRVPTTLAEVTRLARQAGKL